jgi:Domain of unknown function (DUF4124)
MRAILFTLLSVVSVAALSATVYKWVDEDGVTHYSDQPHENAEKVQLTQPQTYSAGSLPAARTSQASAPKQAATTYTCEVTQPANDQSFPNATSVTVGAQISPYPQGGYQGFLLLDGARVPKWSGGSVTIDPIDRGTHSLQAIVQDSSGKVVCQSATVSFTILQPSVLNPANPNFHH